MVFPKVIAVTASLFATACQQTTGPAPEYPAEEAEDVDHAMCLLGFTAVPLQELRTGHHLVEATINGRTGSFVLDTGANMSAIAESQAEQFGISERSTSFGGVVPGAGGGASRVPIDAFEIGSIEIRQERVLTADFGQLLTSLGQASGEDIAGIIGQDVLNEHRAIINVARPMLYLMEEDRDPAPVPAELCRERVLEAFVPPQNGSRPVSNEPA